MGWAGWEDFGQIPTKNADPARQLQGCRNRDLGQAFENIIEAACLELKSQNMAYIEKTPEPFRVTNKQFGPGGKFLGFLGFFTKPAQPDFKGTTAGGRSVCFEAKATMGDRILYEAVTQDQRKALDRHWDLEADVFVLVSLGLEKFYRVPWAIWREMKIKFGRKYMTKDDLAPFALPMVNGILKIL